jgi:V/A-type H+-transporting ATPase subunit E
VAEEHSDTEALRQVIARKAQQDKAAILDQGRAQVADIEAQADQAIAALKAEAQHQAELALERTRTQLVGKAQADQRLAQLEARQRLVQGAFDRAEREIELVLQSEGYAAILRALIQEALAVTGPDACLEVAETEVGVCRGIVKQERLRCTVKSVKERAGTLRVTSADGQRCVDNGLHTRLFRAQVHLQPDVARILFQDRDRPGEKA